MEIGSKHSLHIYSAEFEGHTIQYLSNGEFVINEGDKESGNLWKFFNTLAEVKNYAHQITLTAEAQVDLNLEILNQDGNLVTVRRVHAGTGDWLFKPQHARVVTAYKPCSKVRYLLDQRFEFRRQIEEASEALKPFEIEVRKLHFYRSEEKHAKITAAQAVLKANWDAAPTE